MILELNIKNKKEVFVSTHVTGMLYRDALYLRHRQVNEGFTPSLLDESVDLICRAFGNKFSVSDLYNGMDKRIIFGTVNSMVDAIITQDCNSTIETEKDQVDTIEADEGKTIKELQELYERHCLSLMRQGYKVHEIDSMDINYYFCLQRLLLNHKEKSENNITNGYIDDIL